MKPIRFKRLTSDGESQRYPVTTTMIAGATATIIFALEIDSMGRFLAGLAWTLIMVVAFLREEGRI